ncbi:MAG: cytochrome c biogenesis protein CcdA [bacterium]
MNSILLGILTAFGLGALTVIHPCPLGTNIAAVSFLLGWRQTSGNKILLALFFVVGEILAFSVLAILISMGMLQIPLVANFLQKYIMQFLGPVLILMGMMLAGILLPHQTTLKLSERMQDKFSKMRLWGSLVIGVLIALSFCPMSAAIFFGVLIPLAVANNSVFLYPACFGIGASLPLLVIVVFISRSAAFLSRFSFTNRTTGKKLSTFFGALLIIAGIVMSLRHIFKIV